MPQDHASWDRKDLLRQRKRERTEQSFGSTFRWRNTSTTSSSSHYVPREFSRWGSGDFRRPPGHGKQGGWHQFVEETGHGYATSRSSPRMLEDDHYRPSASRGDWRYNRNSRDGRVSLSQRDWKCHTWDMNNGTPSAFGRPHDMNNDRWSVDERPSHPSDSHSALVKSWDLAESMHQKGIEVCAPIMPLKANNDQNLADQGLSLPSDPLSVHVSLSEQPYSEDKHDNKVCSPGSQHHDLNYDQRSADESSLHPSNSHAELEGTWGHLQFKDQQDSKVCGANGLNIAKQLGKESSFGSIERKHPIWTRSGSFASRGSGFSHSSSSKSLGAVDSSDGKTEFLPKNVAVIETPSGDATACLTSAYLSEETNARKKPRLGWGEGLAKYEKKKIEPPDVIMNGDGTTLLANSTEEVHSLNTNVVDNNPSIIGASDYGSPATPSSVACSSSLGMEDKLSGKSVNASNHVSNLCSSPNPAYDNQLEGCPFNLEKLDNISMEKFGCSLNQLLLIDVSGPENSSFFQLTVMNKVLALKADILKALEMTESEIDSLENELKVLKFEARSHCPHLAGSSSYLCVVNENVSEEQEAPCSLSPQPAPCIAETVEKIPVHNAGLAKVPIDADNEGVDSPGAAASKLSEPSYLIEASSLPQSVASVENTRDVPEIPSIKTFTYSSEVNMSAFANGCLTVNGEVVELSSGGFSRDPNGEDMLCAMISASNRKSACEACEVFNQLLPRELSCIDGSRSFNICHGKVDPQIKRRIAMRRRLLRVKERILVLKFKAFQYPWKKELHQLSATKYHPKSQKKCELSLHAKHSGHLKVPHSARLRFSSPGEAAGRISLAPTTELVNYMGMLLQDTQWKPCRDILRMPALILDEKEKVISRFISSNGLVEDPCAVEKERTIINPWTSEEREIFLNKLAVYGKDFRKIATYLKQKTTADCVDFYYKNHKSDCFEKTKKKLAYGEEGKCTYMLAPGKKWKREMNAASLDLLGAVSVIAANASKVASNRQMSSKRITLGSCSSSKSHSYNSFEGCLPSFDLPQRETVAADILASVCGSLSSEPISSCIRSSIEPGEKCKEYLKLDPTAKESRISDTVHNDSGNDEDDTCSEETCEQTGPIHWTDEERSAFIQAFSLYGKNFAMISRCVGTRSRDQCRVFFSKVRKCLGLELVQPLSGDVSTSASVDNSNDGGGSDLEDPGVMETSSVICSDDPWTKMDMNSPTSPFNINLGGADHSGSVKLKTEPNSSDQENGTACLHWKDNTELVDSNASFNGDHPDLVSEVGSDFIDTRTVENQSQAAKKIRNDHVVFTGTEEGISASAVVSSVPLSSSPTILANVMDESFTERSRNDSERQSVLLPKHDLQNQDSITRAADRIGNPSLQAEATTSSEFSFSECLHHVPIEVCMGDPVGIHLPRENSSTHSDSESPESLAVRVVEKHNLDRLCSTVHPELGGKCRSSGHVDHKQNDSKKPKVSNSESFQIPWSSCMQDSNGKEIAGSIGHENPKEVKSRSNSDVGITTLRRGEDFSLRKCNSLTSNGSTAKLRRLSHKGNRSGHCRSHSRSLSDTERPCENGDVKLFGTILTSHENGNKQSHHPRQNVRTSTQKATNDHYVKGTPGTRLENINQHDLQNVPITSYGFWDGNRIRTGFASLPDSVTLLAKCPDVFANHHSSSVVGNSNEIQPDGLSKAYSRSNGSLLGFERETDDNGV